MRKFNCFIIALFFSFLAAPSFAGDEVNPDEIIRKFAQKESEFRDVWQQYTYTQKIRFQVLGRSENVREERRMVVEVFFNSQGERETRIISDQGELYSVGVTKEDLSDAISLQPFVLTTEELPEYDIEYKGEELVDELHTYVFEVEPKGIRKGERYFKGKIYVDDLDYQIVMTRGKIVPDYDDNKFPEFVTIRQQVDDYWFPTWTEADDVLSFGNFFSRRNDVHVRQLITYSDFQRYEVGTSIQYGGITESPGAEDDSASPESEPEPPEPEPPAGPEGPKKD